MTPRSLQSPGSTRPRTGTSAKPRKCWGSFSGHPNLKNLLLEEDLRIHPLRKAHPLQKPEILQGIEDTKAGFNF
jgi:hypothetical protein